MRENELSIKEDIESLKMSSILEVEKKTDNKEEKNNPNSSSNLFNFDDKASSEEDDSSQLESFDSIANLKNNKIKRKILIYNIKDHILMIFLLISSSMNFSILYIPLFIIGIIYIYLLYNNNNNSKKIKLNIEISCLVYSVILIILKLALIGVIDNGNLEDEKNKMNNIGIRYDVNNKRVFDVIITFIGEGILLIVCIFSVIISTINKKIDMENRDIDILIPKEKIFLRIRILMYFFYILLILFGAYNTSYLTLAYIFIIHFLLIVVIKSNFLINLYIFKNLRLVFLCIFPIHLFLINIFNIYSIQKELLKKKIIPKEVEESEIEKVYSFLTKIGISYSYYHSYDTFIYGCISYIIGSCIILFLSSCKKIINDYNNLTKTKFKSDYELKVVNEKIIEDKSENKNEQKENNKIGFLAKINKNILYFLTHSSFILHIIRILSIIWIYYLRNLFSIGIFINLFFSFILNDIKKIKNITTFLLIPVTIISFICFHISNINGNFENLDEKDEEKYLHYGFEKDENKLKYFLMGIYYLILILFLNSFNINISSKDMNISLFQNKISLTESDTEEEFKSEKLKSLLIKEDENEDIKNNKNKKEENNNNNKNKDNINLINVILKFFYENIDKITLIVMYFISMIRINIIHFIFILIFMLQILQPQIVKRFHLVVIIIIQILFLFEYIVDITKNHFSATFEEKINVFGFLLTLSDDEPTINLNIEIYCYLAIYAFYIQNRLFNSNIYQELEKNEKISFEKYINLKFKNHGTIKKILFIIFNIINEIYVWSMFSAFFCVCCLFEINLLFSIKLAMFFIVVYNYLQKSQIINKDIKISLKINFFLIAYCCFNSFIVYGYQLLCLDLIGFYSHVKKSKNRIVQNLPSIGLINYKNDNDLLYNLLPHFLSNFLSILMYNQIKVIYDIIENKRNRNIINDEEKCSMKLLKDIIIEKKDDNNKIDDEESNDDKILENNNDINTNIIELKNKEKEDEDEDNINNIKSNIIEEKEEGDNSNNKEGEKIENKNKYDINIDDIKNKYYLKYAENRRKIESLNKKYILYLIILFILKLYYPLLMLFICYIFTSYNLSFSIIIYFLIFALNFIFMFTTILNKTCYYDYNFHYHFLFFQLIRYKSVESKRHKLITNLYNYQIFKYISKFNFIFLFLNYLYSIIYQLQDCNDNEEADENSKCKTDTPLIENVSYGKFIKSSAYLFGTYNFSDKGDLLDSCWIYILLCFLIFIDVYIQKIKKEIDKNKKNNRNNYIGFIRKKISLKCILNAIKNIEINLENKNIENYQILKELIKNYENNEINKIKKIRYEKNNFVNDFINIFKKSKNNLVLLSKTSLKRNIIIFLRIGKKIIEYFIIFVLICGVIIKVNIWSILYMGIVIYLLITKKNLKKFKNLFIIINISIFIQSIIFLSNLTDEINPKNDSEIIEIINDTFSIPWYEKALGNNYKKHSTLLGLGIYDSQLYLIWVEYVIIFLIYIYLYYFCYSIFNNDLFELNVWRKNPKNSLIYSLLLDKEVRESLLKMKHTQKYQKISKCMKYNFDVNLPPFSEILKSLNLQMKNNENNISNNEEKYFQISITNYIIFLFGHNIILIIIAIISMITYGVLSVIYIGFCLFFLYKSESINKGKKYFYPFVIKTLLRPIIIADISCQLIIQIPYIYSRSLSKDDGIFKDLSEGIGFIKIIDIDNEYKLTNKTFLILGKCFCFFCMCLQKVIYSSQSFNEFYLKYLIIKKGQFNIISLINTFIFNNKRIKTMNKSLQLKKDMEDLMKNLQNDLKEWNKKLLFQENDNEKIQKDDINNKSNIISEKIDISNNIDENNNINSENININNIKNSDNIDNDNNSKDSENMDINNNEIKNNINNNNLDGEMRKLDEKPIIENQDNNIGFIDYLLNTSLNADKLVDEEFVKKIVKKWILNQSFLKKYLIKIYLYINKKAFCYRMISYRKEKDNFIFNTIKGENENVHFLESKIDKEISKLNLSSFKNSEIGTLKKYLKRLNKINSYDFTKIIFFLNNQNEAKIEKKKKLNEKLEKLIKEEKYKQFSKIKNSKLFQKYLKKRFLVKHIILDIQTILINNFHWICYFIMILNHILNASIISLFYPISIFCYALLEYPRPSKIYWNICLIYTYIVLIIKSSLQREFIGAIINMKHKYDSMKTFFEHYPIGIKLFEEDDKTSLLGYLLIDFVLIIVLNINIHILISNGLWDINEQYIENIYDAMNRLSMNKDLNFENDDELKEFNEEYLSDKMGTNKYLKRNSAILKSDKKDYKKMLQIKDQYIEETKSYFQKLFPKIRNEKPGKDFYYAYSLPMIILIFYILLFYTRMVQDKTFGSVDISTNQFSGMSIILVIVHMLILIIDRVIYLRQNRYILKYEYFFYEKKKHKLISNIEFNEIKKKIGKLYPDSIKDKNFKIPLEYISELNKKYNIIIFQLENFNIPLLHKYILHILLTILSHLFIFFYITMTGNYNIYNEVYCIKESSVDECNDFLENKTIVIFYLIVIIYHIFSALQIKYGFYDLKRKSIFKNVESLQGLLFQLYKLIPFYYQIKNIVDWTFTPTSLDLFDWFKFENVYDEIFKTYRLKYPIEKKPIGKKIKNHLKMIIGGLSSSFLILIIILPLILFSTLNPTNKLNNITSAQMKIYLSFIDNKLQEKNYLIFENYWAEGINEMTNKAWKKFRYDNSFYSKTFPKKQVQIVSFYNEPENTLSEFKLYNIMSSIDSLFNITNSLFNNEENFTTCNLLIETEFSRQKPSEAKIVTKVNKILICDSLKDENSEGCKGLNNSNNYFRGYSDDTDFYISGFSPFVRLTSDSEPKEIEFEQNYMLNIKPLYKNKSYYYEIDFLNSTDINNNNSGIQFHVFNDKVSSSTYGYTLIGFYSVFILFIGNIVATVFSYEPEKLIISEMPHPEKLLNLCECVKISRYIHDFKKEEYLFNILMEILRTPEFLKRLTQSTVEQFQRRAALPS